MKRWQNPEINLRCAPAERLVHRRWQNPTESQNRSAARRQPDPFYFLSRSSTAPRLIKISMPSARDEANALTTTIPTTLKTITTAAISSKVMFTGKLRIVRESPRRNETSTAHGNTVHIYEHRQAELVGQTSIFHRYVRNIVIAPIRRHLPLTRARENAASNDSGHTKHR